MSQNMPEIRQWHSTVEEVLLDGERPCEEPLLRVAIAAVIKNPYAGRWADSLEQLEDAGGYLAAEMMRRAMVFLGGEVKAYGKGGIVGEAGELEHVAAVLHPQFGGPTRSQSDGISILPSVKKRGGQGSSLDIPVHHKKALLIRSHFDAMEIRVPGAPAADELVVALAVTSGPRPHARVGGLTEKEAEGINGLN